ncbi:hypothetical protein ACLOJK_033751 [Asimina triloba]
MADGRRAGMKKQKQGMTYRRIKKKRKKKKKQKQEMAYRRITKKKRKKEEKRQLLHKSHGWMEWEFPMWGFKEILWPVGEDEESQVLTER